MCKSAHIRKQASSRCALGAAALAAAVIAAMSHGGSWALGGTLYWDTDGSTAGNNASNGANLGGSGNWSTGDANWWDTTLATPQPWSDGSDAVFWGTAGTATASTVSVNSLTFKRNGYAVNSGTLNMTGAPSNFTVDSGVTATIGSTIAGSVSMAKLGAGTLVLTNTANSNTAVSGTGGWLVSAGTLRVNADGNFGVSPGSGVTDLQINQATIQAGADFTFDVSRRTKINTNSSTANLGDAVIDVNEHNVTWYGSIQGGLGTLRVTGSNGNGGMLTLGTDHLASINPFGEILPGGTVNLTVENHVVVQTSGQVTPTGGELGAEKNKDTGAVLAILLQNGGQLRAESGGYVFQRNIILGPGGGSFDTGAWQQHIDGGTVSGPGSLSKFGLATLIVDNSSATWAGGTFVRDGTLQLGVGGSNGLLPGVSGSPSSVVIDSTGTLKFLRGSNKSFFDNISGGGNVVIANSNNAKVRLVSDNTYTGVTTITSGILMIGQGNPGEPGSIVSNVVNNSELDFNRVEDITYGGSISGSGTVMKMAAGTLKLTGIHSYSGATTVSKGKLFLSGSLGTTFVNVAGGAALGGTGSIGGSITLAGGSTAATQGTIDLRDGVLAPLKLTDANSADTVLSVGDAAASNPSVLDFDVGSVADVIQLNAGKLVVNAGGGTVNITPLSGFGPGTYDLITFGSGQASGLSGLTLSTAGLPGTFTYQLQSTSTAEQLVVSVPEPSATLLMFIGGVRMLTRRRRRS